MALIVDLIISIDVFKSSDVTFKWGLNLILLSPEPRIIILFLNAAFSVLLIQNNLGIYLIIGLIFLGITWGPLIAILLTHLTDTKIIQSKQAGLAGGLFFTMAEIGGIIGPVSIGIIYDYSNNFNTALSFYSFILVVMIIPVILLKRLD